MGKINNYQTDTPNPGDKILGSEESTGATKNFTAQSIADLGRSTKIYRAFLSQSGTNDPVAVVVPGNTIIGSFTYIGVGTYTFYSNGSFDNVKAACIVDISGAEGTTYEFNVVDENQASFKTYYNGTLANGLMLDLFIEITTYEV